MTFMHCVYHLVARGIQFNNLEFNFFAAKFFHEIFEDKAIRRSVWEVVNLVMILIAMTRCVTDQVNSLRRLFCPVLNESKLETALDIFWIVATAYGLRLLYELFYALSVVCEW